MPFLDRSLLTFGLVVSISVSANWLNSARSQENHDEVREIAAYQFSSSSSGVSVLGGGGQFLQEPGNPYSVEMREALRTEVEGEYAIGETFSISGSVIEDTGSGMFFNIPEIGICGVAIKRGPILACQMPSSGGERALTDAEERWVRWSAYRIERYFESLSGKSAEERSDAALIAGTLPSELVVPFLDELETDIGASSILDKARENWARTQELIGSNWVAHSPELLEAIAVQDAAKVSELLSAGANPNTVSEGGETALIAAARTENADIVAALLMEGADPRRASENGDTAGDLTKDAGLSRLLELAGVAFDNAAATNEELGELVAKSKKLEDQMQKMKAELETAQARLESADGTTAEAVHALSEAEVRVATLVAELSVSLTEKLAMEREKQSIIDDLTTRVGEIEKEKLEMARQVEAIGVALRVMENVFDPESLAAVKFVQSRLNALGYDAGPADGQFGRRTKLAIGAFQRAGGREEDEEISVELVRSLALTLP